jgi:hypothetical protein
MSQAAISLEISFPAEASVRQLDASHSNLSTTPGMLPRKLDNSSRESSLTSRQRRQRAAT